MKRKIIAVFLGLLISLLLLFIMGIHLRGWVVKSILPPFVGSFATGYLTQHKGWLYGFFVAVLLETGGIVLLYIAWGSLYIAPLENAVSWIIDIWINPGMIGQVATASGVIGGFLGQLLAQKWHKRKRQVSSTS